MSAAAQLARPVAEADDAYDVAVLLLEEVHGALRHRFLIWSLPVVKGKAFAHLLHDAKVDASQLILRHSAVERDVESRVIGPDPRPLLHHLLTDRLAQRFVKKMGRRMMARNLATPPGIDHGSRLVANPHLACDYGSHVRDDTVSRLLRVL